MRLLGACLLALSTSACSAGLFSGIQYPDLSRPVVLVETRGGVEHGAATEAGIVILARTAPDGPCRVHYFLGRTPMVEEGTIEPFGGIYAFAEMDLSHQHARLLGRDLTPEDRLVVLLHGGVDAIRVPVTLALDPRVEGDVLAWPGRPLPAGSPLFVADDAERLHFVGLVTGELRLGDGEGQRFLTFGGTDRMREALAVPIAYPRIRKVHYRPDDIPVVK